MKLKIRFTRILLSGLLALSLALNILLWSLLLNQSNQLKVARLVGSEIDELRRQNQELQINRTGAPNSASADARDLLRLRNEVGQLRTQAGEAATLRTQAAEAAQLRARLATATQDLARAESELADAIKLSPEELRQVKEEAQSVGCVNNLKQIGLAARKWADAHQSVFPPDFISMKDELGTPKILVCPADTAAIRVTEWSQLNPSSVSYRLLNPSGDENDLTKTLAECPIHGNVVLSDHSVHPR